MSSFLCVPKKCWRYLGYSYVIKENESMSLRGNRIGTIIKDECAKQRGYKSMWNTEMVVLVCISKYAYLEVSWTSDLQSIPFILSQTSSLPGRYREIEAKMLCSHIHFRGLMEESCWYSKSRASCNFLCLSVLCLFLLTHESL